jgi:PDZ domain-containing protein
METAQTNAALVAAQLAARRPPAGGTGLQVTGTADDVGLRPGDVLLAGGDDGKLVPLRAPEDLRALAARRTPLRLLVVPKDSGGSWGPAEIRDVSGAGLASVRAGPRVSAAAYPLGSVRGPSAGLVLALARLDALTPGDLTGGRRVAGTGAIGSDGTVTTVGEIPEKVRAAVAAHIGVFFVPAWQVAEATAAARSAPMRVVPVRSVQEAVAWLCDTGSRIPVC